MKVKNLFYCDECKTQIRKSKNEIFNVNGGQFCLSCSQNISAISNLQEAANVLLPQDINEVRVDEVVETPPSIFKRLIKKLF